MLTMSFPLYIKLYLADLYDSDVSDITKYMIYDGIKKLFNYCFKNCIISVRKLTNPLLMVPLVQISSIH